MGAVLATTAQIVKGFPNIQGYKLSTLLKYIDINGLVPSLKGI